MRLREQDNADGLGPPQHPMCLCPLNRGKRLDRRQEGPELVVRGSQGVHVPIMTCTKPRSGAAAVKLDGRSPLSAATRLEAEAVSHQIVGQRGQCPLAQVAIYFDRRWGLQIGTAGDGTTRRVRRALIPD